MRTLSSLDNDLVKHLVRLRDQTSYRKKGRTFFAEGKKLIHDLALLTPPATVLATDPAFFPQSTPEDSKILVSPQIMKKVSSLAIEDSLIAEFPKKTFSQPEKARFILVLDAIQDPGNLGTLLRTASFLSWDAIFLLNGTADPYHPKTIRASQGAAFFTPVIEGDEKALYDWIEKTKLPVVIADPRGKNAREMHLKSGAFLILGNEGSGIRKAFKERFQPVAIPTQSPLESLNVAAAGAILMHYLIGENER